MRHENSKRNSTAEAPNKRLLCPVSGQPVRYRDPFTGAGYYSQRVYKVLHSVAEGDYQWDNTFGCYVAKVGQSPAAGVPDGFATAAS